MHVHILKKWGERWSRAVEKMDAFFYDEGARDKKDRPWIVFFWVLFSGVLAMEWLERKKRKAKPIKAISAQTAGLQGVGQALPLWQNAGKIHQAPLKHKKNGPHHKQTP